ncbi:MAG TPA: hypothetical protein VK570_17330, partial [Rubrivivax sp.]|nr:hypothetical protein [Rubrivivax sp.]
QLRNQNAVLRRGNLSAPLLADQNLIVLVRRLGEQWAITATNNAATLRQVTVPLPEGMAPGLLEDALGDTPVQAEASGISFDVPAGYGRVLLRR